MRKDIASSAIPNYHVGIFATYFTRSIIILPPFTSPLFFFLSRINSEANCSSPAAFQGWPASWFWCSFLQSACEHHHHVVLPTSGCGKEPLAPVMLCIPWKRGVRFIHLCIHRTKHGICLTECLLNRVNVFFGQQWEISLLHCFPLGKRPFCGIGLMAEVRFQKLSLACLLFHSRHPWELFHHLLYQSKVPISLR